MGAEAGDADTATGDEQAFAWVHDVPAPTVVCVSSTVAGANRSAAVLLCTSPERLVGSELSSFFHEDERTAIEEAVGNGDEQRPEAPPLRARLAGSGPTTTFVDLSTTGKLRAPSWPEPLAGRAVVVTMSDVTEEVRVAAAFGVCASGAYLLDDDLRILWMPAAAERALALDSGQLVGQDILDLVHPEDVDAMRDAHRSLLEAPGRTEHLTVRAAHPMMPGTYWRLGIDSSAHHNDPALGGVLVRWTMELNIDEETDPESSGSAESASGHDRPSTRPQSGGQVMKLTESLPVGVISGLATGRLGSRNALARELLGPSLDGTAGREWIDGAIDDHAVALHELLDNAETGRRTSPALACFERPGQDLWLRVNATPQTDSAGRPVGWVATLLDVTAETIARQQLEEARRQLWYQAHHDQLTGLPTRALFAERVDEAINDRPDGLVALLYCDLDGFKEVNDRVGHDAGDRVLVAVAERLARFVDERGAACRVGGDEFVIVLDDPPSDHHAEQLARELIARIEQPIPIGGQDVRVSASIGVTVIDRGQQSAGALDYDSLLRQTDRAMYRAKSAGRGRAVRA